MGKEFWHSEANNVDGRTFGFAQIDCISECSLLSASPIAWHVHRDTEVVCCIKGAMTYEFKKNLTVTLTVGCFLVIPRGLEHRLVGGIDGPSRRVSFFLHDARARSGHPMMFSNREYRDILADILRHRLSAKHCPDNLLPILTRVADIAAAREPSAHECVELRTFTAVLLLAFAATKAPESRPKPQLRLIDESIRWLELHAHEKVTLDQITAYMGYGKTHFCALFKARTGLPPLEWLVRHRIERARTLLENGDLSIAEVARRVGFEDAAFFARTFRKRLGSTPSDYRAQNARPQRR